MSGVYESFIGNLKKHGVAKTSHFRLSLPLAFAKGKDGREDKFTNIEEVLTFRCEATELPGRQLVSNDSRTYGPSYKTPYQSIYQELTLNFVETANFFVRGVFEAWMDNIFNSSTNRLTYPNTYRKEVSLIQFDVNTVVEANQLKKTPAPLTPLKWTAIWTLYNSFPTAINQMPVSWAEDGLHRTTVTLAFEWYTLRTGDNAEANPQDKINSPPVAPKGSARP